MIDRIFWKKIQFEMIPFDANFLVRMPGENLKQKDSKSPFFTPNSPLSDSLGSRLGGNWLLFWTIWDEVPVRHTGAMRVSKSTKKRIPPLAGAAERTEHRPACELRGRRFDSGGSGHMPGLPAWFPVGGVQEATTRCFLPSFPSPFSSL